MKKIYSIVFLLALFCVQNTVAQNDCSTPYLLGSSTYTYPAVTGTPNPDTTNNYGCVFTTNNPTWFYFQVCTSGSIDLTISSSGSSVDVDFVAWGPLALPTDCGLDSSQIVDCSYSTAGTETITIPSATVGLYYKILITNFSNLPGTVAIMPGGFMGGSICDSTYCGTLLPQQICKVTTDPVLNHNFIFWDKDTTFVGDYDIQRETTTMGVYASIAIVPSTDTSVYEDMTANPMIQAFKYRIETIDTCGGTLLGSPHTTIHLLTSISSSTGFPQLNWSSYSGFSYWTYYISRGTSPATLMLYDSISASFNMYTDVMPVSGMNYYSISVYPPIPCNPSHAPLERAYSNVAPVMFTGIAEASFPGLNIYPNPANEVLNIAFGNNALDAEVRLIDVTGRVVISKTFSNETHASISLAEIANGSYTVVLSSEKGSIHRNIVIVR